ncbi:MAG: ABC transporter substrate-binding protein [Desulfuromonadales bacterium]
MRKIALKKLVLLVLLSLVMPAVGMAADTIKIGVAGPHSGDLAPYGIPTKEAAEMVAAQVNANGGVLGKQVEVIPMDDQCKPEIATNAAG